MLGNGQDTGSLYGVIEFQGATAGRPYNMPRMNPM